MGKISDLIINIKAPTPPDFSVVRKDAPVENFADALRSAMAKVMTPPSPDEQRRWEIEEYLDRAFRHVEPDIAAKWRRDILEANLSYGDLYFQVDMLLNIYAIKQHWDARDLFERTKGKEIRVFNEYMEGSGIDAMQERRRHQWRDRSKRRRKR